MTMSDDGWAERTAELMTPDTTTPRVEVIEQTLLDHGITELDEAQAANVAVLRQSPQERIDRLLASIATLQTTIGSGTDPAGTTSLQAMRNIANANILTAQNFKAALGFQIDIARESRRIARDAVALARLSLGALDSTDTGTE